MTQRTRTIVSALKVIAVAAITVLLFILVINAMKNPVEGKTNSYTADFTDASGLNVNGDVRMKGMRIGKVTAVDLTEAGGRPVARVGFTMDDGHRLTENTALAIKYQNLTGVRYVDVADPKNPGREVESLPADKTTPSFDITELFNGLQPVLSTMNTEQVNEFSENAISLLQGDGAGLAPMLDNAQRLASFASDRQSVIETLMKNMGRIADSMGGRSQYVIQFLEAVNVPISNAMTVLEEFPKTATYGPALLEPIEQILKSLGVSPDLDVNVLLKATFHSMTDALNSFKLMPSALAGLKLSQSGSDTSKRCSRGPAQLPTDVRVLLNGSGVVLCAK
ncbi:MlaD family protein [Gordonia soli]|uniref:Mce family protein n=1 Tax=Gordonia soli NBRC 108243 TaxID=1223545 RepID=M0QIQ6_9ACTN|nr:MlaD family protein [Gordonia soli]GAC68505.1 Mce family protein [Gordonia soli NBRC 108243]